ncbi:MAG TPA: aldehyde dehydrogenase family protein [Chthoniobacterales bacterium]|nr:aldehyde dehydrogenase family protein [Chthoniobacterales bacterium]
MNTIDAVSVAAERNEYEANLENGFYNIVNGERISNGKKRSGTRAAINQQLAAVPDLEHALMAMAMSAARNALSGWAAVPFENRKAMLASLLNKLHDRADELSALVTAEQRVTLAEARWEI